MNDPVGCNNPKCRCKARKKERDSQSQYFPYNMQCVVDWILPIVTVSESNSTEHWHKKAVRHTLQKKWIWAEWQSKKPPVILPCHIKMTRIASRKLDKEENLPMAFKWIKDQIADLITPGLAAGRADDNELMSWEYDQVKGEPKEKAVRIQIFC